ncbi:MAG: hypothetical protein M3R25_12100, partial [Bacteroidota bacterium]|nr:hypothetical protein [Bacteroidota bacterium]
MQILIFCLCILQIFDLLQENKEDGIGFEQLVQTDLSYNSLKEEIRNARAKLHQDIPHDSVSTLCTEYLVNKLIPHWLST